jgi:hypothetical protein
VIESLHGLSFSLYKISSVSLCSKISPPNLQTTTLTIAELFYQCLGQGSGVFVGGLVYGWLGAVGMWRGFATVLEVMAVGVKIGWDRQR